MASRKGKADKSEDVPAGLAAEKARDLANREDQVAWLKIHAVRTVTVDLATVVFFIKGFLGAFA